MDATLSPLQLAGFLLASWAVIGNDSLQTLGPFLQANRGRTPRWLQALALCAVLCGVLLLGWWRNGGDASWGRLASYPPPGLFGWPELLPPLAVLLLTQAGVPVSTSFLLLTAFTPANLPALLRRSLLGYGLAMVMGLLIYGAAVLWSRWWAARSPASGELPATAVRSGPWELAQPGPASVAVAESPSRHKESEGAGSVAVAGAALALQWLACGWLWSQWLIQDLANIFIYLPRRPDGRVMALALAVLCLGVCLLLAEGGGAIQAIVRRKSGLQAPRAGAALSLVYGLILMLLAVWGREPLSTTWVFLGLLAGRELALSLQPQGRPAADLAHDLGRDLALAALGLAVSLAVALAVQPLRSVP